MCVCVVCSFMRSSRIINSRSSSVETTEVEVLYEKRQGLKHTHTVGYLGTGTISAAYTFATPIPFLFLIPLNCSFSSSPPLPLHPAFTLFPLLSLYHLGSP